AASATSSTTPSTPAHTNTTRGSTSPASTAAATPATSANTDTDTPTVLNPSTTPKRSAPITAQSPAGTGASAPGAHSTANRASATPASADRSWSAVTGRVIREATDTTGAPVPSAAVTVRLPWASRRSLARSTDAPLACNSTPVHANGNRT